jgi:hypothetical protein
VQRNGLKDYEIDDHLSYCSSVIIFSLSSIYAVFSSLVWVHKSHYKNILI